MGIIVTTSSNTQNFQTQTFISGQVTVKQPDSVETKTTETDENQMDSSQETFPTTTENFQEVVSISISREGLEKLDEHKTAFSPDIDLERTQQLGWDLSKTTNEYAVSGDLFLSWKALNKEGGETDQNLLKAYAEKYNEIKAGHANGIREVYVSNDDNKGFHLATEEEEIALLDKGLENCAEWYEICWDAKESNMKLQLLGERYQEKQQYEWDKRHGRRAEQRSDEEWERYATLKQEEFAKYKKENYIENFAERVTRMQAFVKTQYSQYGSSSKIVGNPVL